MKPIFYILLVLLTAAHVHAQQPPILHCLAADVNGDVTLNWALSAPDPDIMQFEIYYAAGSGAFSNVATLPASTFSYTHMGAGADLGARRYYVKAVFAADDLDSDTLRTIYLQVDNNQPDFNQADLQWNSMQNPMPDGYTGYYTIWREYPLDNWTLYDSVLFADTLFSEPVIVCNDSISYQIVIEHSSGCRSSSNIRGALFKDVEYPLEPLFDSVSINSNGLPVLGWSPSASDDVTGYIVYRFEAGNWIEIDRISGRDSTFYIDSVSDPCSQSISYAIAALDSCANKSPGTFANPRNTLLLNDVDNNVCNNTNTLNWNAYNNAEPPLDAYIVYFSVNGGPFQTAGQVGSAEMNFVHQNLQPGLTYTYYVQAVFGQRSSSSCKKSVEAGAYLLPAFSYFANADVLPSNNIQLTIQPDTAVDYCTLNIFRNDPRTGLNVLINTTGCGTLADVPLVVTDEDVDPGLGPFFYYAEVLDSCGNPALVSNENKTIFLAAENISTSINRLQWNAFEGWDAGVDKYYIFRIIDGNEPIQPIDSVDASVLEYEDDITVLPNSIVDLSYRVQAVENAGNSYGFRARANSNRASASGVSEMFMPNAFRPGGYTQEFKPVFRFFSGQHYLFQIFNRWGQLIFETSDPQAGWDGTYKGNRVPQGAYVYQLVYQNIEASPVTNRGTVTVIY